MAAPTPSVFCVFTMEPQLIAPLLRVPRCEDKYQTHTTLLVLLVLKARLSRVMRGFHDGVCRLCVTVSQMSPDSSSEISSRVTM